MSAKHCLITMISLFPLTLSAAGKHVHGEAELFIAQQDSKLLIELESPADNLLGFEHAPKTKAQKHQLHEVLEKLATHLSIVDSSAGNCQQIEQKIGSPFEKHDNHAHEEHHEEHAHEEHHEEHAHEEHHEEHAHEEHHEEHAHEEHHEEHAHEEHHEEHHHDNHEDHEDGHTEFHLSYTLNCQNLDNLSTVKVTAFEHFSGFEKITVNWVTADKQGSGVATSENPVIGIQ